jgi:hypothetical protein
MRLWPCSTIVSIASSKDAVACIAAIAIRGTITSWTPPAAELDDRVDHLLLLGLEDPCSPPRSTMRRSSSAVIDASLLSVAPKSRVIAAVTPVRSAMTGPRARARKSIGSDRTIANRSVLARASVLGTSSAKTMVKSARMTVTMTSARPSPSAVHPGVREQPARLGRG